MFRLLAVLFIAGFAAGCAGTGQYYPAGTYTTYTTYGSPVSNQAPPFPQAPTAPGAAQPQNAAPPAPQPQAYINYVCYAPSTWVWRGYWSCEAPVYIAPRPAVGLGICINCGRHYRRW